MTTETISNVIKEASILFIRQGYSKTNISQVAKGAGIATGSMYHLFENKTALLQFVLSCSILDTSLETTVYPVIEKSNSILQDELGNAFLKKLSNFSKHDVSEYSFEEMLNDAFDLIHKTAACNLIFEHNQADCHDFMNAYRTFRKLFFDTIKTYLQEFIRQGVLKPITSIDLAVRFIIETLSFWGMHLPYDAFAPDETITLEQAKAVSVQTLCQAYLL